MRFILLLSLSFIFVAPTIAADKPIAESKYQYALFDPQPERQWMSLDKVHKQFEEDISKHPNIEHPPGHGGMIEVNAFAGSAQTKAQTEAADKLHKGVKAAMLEKGWFSFAKAAKDGYNQQFDQVHFLNEEYLNDGEVLNPNKPEFLIFYDTEHGKMLAGVMFYVEEQLAHGPQPGGSQTVWHFHPTPQTCWENRNLLGVVSSDGKCHKGTRYERSPEMLHVWIADHPQGKFATNMMILTNDLLKNEWIIGLTDKPSSKEVKIEKMDHSRHAGH